MLVVNGLPTKAILSIFFASAVVISGLAVSTSATASSQKAANREVAVPAGKLGDDLGSEWLSAILPDHQPIDGLQMLMGGNWAQLPSHATGGWWGTPKGREHALQPSELAARRPVLARLSTAGFIETFDGYWLLGKSLSAEVEDPAALAPIQLAPEIESSPTTTVDISANIRRLEKGQGIPARQLPFASLEQPDSEPLLTFSVPIYDLQGVGRDLFFSITGCPNEAYRWQADLAQHTLGDSTQSEIETIGSGTLVFAEDGSLVSASNISVVVHYPETDLAQKIVFQFGHQRGQQQVFARGLSLHNRDSELLFIGQDGRPAGRLAAVYLRDDQTVWSYYTNGRLQAEATTFR